MAVTFGDFLDRVGRALKDPNHTQYEVGLIYDSFIAAQNAIMPWIPKIAIFTLEAGEKIYQLDAEIHQVEAVRDTGTGSVLPRATLFPGQYRGDASSSNDWLIYPTGSINFSSALEDDAEVYAQVFWNIPEDEDDTDFELEPPSSCHQGMLYYAMSHCLSPKLISGGNLAQYKARPELGDPEDNPMARNVELLRKLFYDEMLTLPKRDGIV
jgi:hypothetical protein